MRTQILLVGFLVSAIGCQSDSDNGDVIIPSVERDMMRIDEPRIADVSIPDMASVSDGATSDSSGIDPMGDGSVVDAGLPDTSMAVDAGFVDADAPGMGNAPVPPNCVDNGQNCGEVCRWVSECAFAGGCVTEDANRPALITSCLRTCNETPPYADIMCGFNSCVPTLDLANNDGSFAALCRGELPPEMNDQGVAECIALNQCLGDCMGDQVCLDACSANATPEANERFQAIITCLQQNQCFTPAGELDQACLDQNCEVESERCLGPQVRPIGQGTCNGLLTCLNECVDGDRACINVCVQLSSPAAFALYRAAVDCVQDNCIGNDPQCQQQNCGAEINACVAN
ncbi:MAG: hypothetical protein CMH52_00385 [Myxococcales bacterium]|nr:hypothetical protein [Myxococcales bacterium]